ncbi:MAG: Holliday junction branch migration protein RuvA [Candidatus Saccharimonadales bacterium]
MIATLEGTVSEKLLDTVVLNIGGVGYGVLVPAEDYGKLAVGGAAKLYIYEHIREAAHDLYGFCALDTKALFELLLSVNGIGPRMALNMLSIGSGREVKQAIASGDTKFIQAANGVGKRVAERVVVDLKDKVGLVGVNLDSTGLLQSDSRLLQDEAVEGLMSLGYTAPDAARALDGISNDLSTEDRIKKALSGK